MTVQQVAIFGATSGIAEQVARQYAEQGVELFLFARNEERGRAIADDCKVRGAKDAHLIVADLADIQEHTKLVQSLRDSASTLSRVLVAYGTLPDQEDVQDDFEKIAEVLNVNAMSTISLLVKIVSSQPAEQNITIGVITSVAGDRGRKSNYVYGTAKGALSLFLQGLRNRMYGGNIRIVDIRPGFVDTPMTSHLKKGPLFASAEQVARGIIKSLEKGGDIVYLPRFWKGIMFVIRSIPEFIFKRLSI